MTPLLLLMLVVIVVCGDYQTPVVNSSSLDSLVTNNYTLQEPEPTTTVGTTITQDVDITMLMGSEMLTQTSSTIAAEDETSTRCCSSGSCFGWDKYYRLADMFNYLEYLQKKYPKLMAVETIGYTAEERPINLVKILSTTNNTKTNAVWLDAGVHAREWITSAAALYILHEILESLSVEAANSRFSGLDFYVVPMMNPDGYEYSHTTDRLWRKNRSLNNGSSCVGTDLNRNWGFKWGGRESTSDPCSSNYRGKYAFSESESASASKYILKKRTQIKAYLSLHSYGQSILFPWAYTSIHTSDFKDLYDLAYYMATKIKSSGGVNYRYGTVSGTFYLASGGSQDWIKAEAGVKYSYTMELRDNGRYGFDLPNDLILETSKDAFAAFTVLAQKIKTGKYFV